MLSNISRALTYLCAILYGILGGILFFFPEGIAPVFAWKVTPFITMTIGGWCLGNAWLAWISARRWQWGLVYTGLIYLWLFGTLETVILIIFRGRVNLAHPVAWFYIVTLLGNVLTAIVGFWDLMRIKPAYERFGPPTTAWQRGLALAFVIFVGFLSIYGLIAQIGWPATRGGIFPEEMSLFTLRSFAAFYFSLAVSALPLIREQNRSVLLHHSIANYALVVMITVAAFVYIRLFDFVQRPGGLLYFGAYLIVGIPLLFIFLKYGTGLKAE
jgi:hypothetical protein